MDVTYHAKVIAGGKIVIPADLRREFDIKDGDTVAIEREDGGGISVKTFAQVVKEEQLRFRAAVGPDYSVEQFLTDKRNDWPDE